MKRNTRFLRAAALGAALLLAAVIGCKNESGGEAGSNTLPSTDGLLTITGIDECFDGKYAFVASPGVMNGSELNLWGTEVIDKSKGTTTGIKIEGGKALIPIYAYTFERDIPAEESVKSSIFSSYSGSDTVNFWFMFLINAMFIFLWTTR